MSDQTTLASLMRAIENTLGGLPPNASGGYALRVLRDHLHQEMLGPRHPDKGKVPSPGMDESPAGTAEDGTVFAHYRLPEPLRVERLGNAPSSLIADFAQEVDGDDVRALWAVLKARLPIPIPMESQAHLTKIEGGFSAVGTTREHPVAETPRGLGLMIDTLHRCEEQFEHYAELHDRKGTDEGREKAGTNREMARLCRVAMGVEPEGDAA